MKVIRILPFPKKGEKIIISLLQLQTRGTRPPPDLPEVTHQIVAGTDMGAQTCLSLCSKPLLQSTSATCMLTQTRVTSHLVMHIWHY